MNVLSIDPAFSGRDRTGCVLLRGSAVVRAFEVGGMFANQVEALADLACRENAACLVDATGGGRAMFDCLHAKNLPVSGVSLRAPGTRIQQRGGIWTMPSATIWDALKSALSKRYFIFDLEEREADLLVSQLVGLDEVRGKVTGKRGRYGRDDVATALAMVSWAHESKSVEVPVQRVQVPLQAVAPHPGRVWAM